MHKYLIFDLKMSTKNQYKRKFIKNIKHSKLPTFPKKVILSSENTEKKVQDLK